MSFTLTYSLLTIFSIFVVLQIIFSCSENTHRTLRSSAIAFVYCTSRISLACVPLILQCGLASGFETETSECFCVVIYEIQLRKTVTDTK
jgi:hypothetical protein